MSKRRRQSELPRSASSIDRFLSWSDSYRKVSKWFLQLDLERELDDNAGLVQLRDFLPLRVAQGALDILKQVPEVRKSCHCVHMQSNLYFHGHWTCQWRPLMSRMSRGGMQAEWNATCGDDDAMHNNIAHGFLSVKDPAATPGLEQLFRLFHLLLPEELNSFSIARCNLAVRLLSISLTAIGVKMHPLQSQVCCHKVQCLV